jgi:glycosyltransferase involved in cell wall biosynthesis
MVRDIVASHPTSSPARRLRIVHVSPAYAPLVGGAERLLQSVSERLVERGHEVTVLTSDCATIRDFQSRRGAGLPRSETVNGVHVRRFSPSGPPTHALALWWSRQPGGCRTLAWRFGRELWPLELPSGMGMTLPLARLEADVIATVNWHFGMAYWACPPRHPRRIPRVAVPILHVDREWAGNPMYSRMLPDCDAAIVCTDAERDFVQARGGRSVSVAGVGVEPRHFAHRDAARIRARYGIAGGPVVGFIGRQHTLKGVPTLIESMVTVWRDFPEATLLLAGQSAHRERAVDERLAALSDEHRTRVVLIDDFADEDGPSILDACDVVALPSIEEAFGMVLIEAWMCGKPVIGGDTASTRCIIEPGVDGLIVTPFDSAQLAEGILELLADPSKRAAFGARGRDKVLSRYTWDRVTDVWEATFSDVAARTSTAS